MLLFAARLGAQVRPAGHIPFAKKLSVIQTEYFDFIFPEESSAAARTLASCADDMYRKIAHSLEVQHTFRIPVVITRRTEVLNAYFTVIPYNRIVLYDSVPPPDFAVFSDTIVSVFYHELVHALSLNVKSPFWRGVSRFAGDAYSPSLIVNLPTSFVEGIAVSFESAQGEGRLNDSLSLHVLRQAKIENKFPDVHTVAGSYSSYTDGSLPYIFGAAFNEYLQKTYGMHTYADFWKNSGRLHFFKLSAGIFKKTYGIRLKEAWKDFEQSVELAPYAPQLPPPLFAAQTAEDKTALKGERLYKSLTFAEDAADTRNGGTFAWYDQASSSVWNAAVGEDGRIVQKPFVLYRSDLSERLSFSRNGDFLVSSGLSGTVQTAVHDAQTGHCLVRFDGLRGGTIVRSADGKDIFAGVGREADSLYIALYDMKNVLRRPHSKQVPYRKIPFERGRLPFDICDTGDGRLVCLVKQPGKNESAFTYSLFFHDLQNGSSYSYMLSPYASRSFSVWENGATGEFSDETNIGEELFAPALYSLSVYKNTAFISCALKASFQPVLARTDLSALTPETFTQTGTAFLSVQKTQYSGGVFSPAAFGGGTAFISRFYEHRRLSYFAGETEGLWEQTSTERDWYRFELLSVRPPSDSFTDGPRAAERIPAFSERTTAALETDAPQKNFKPKPYRPLSYLKKGMLIPGPGFLNASFFEYYPADIFLPGFSVFSGDPAERFLLTAGAGIYPADTHANVNLFAALTDAPFDFSAGTYIETDWYSLTKAAAKTHIGFQMPLGLPFSRVYAGNATYYAHDFLQQQRENAAFFENKVNIGFRYARKTGVGTYDLLGFSAGILVSFQNSRIFSAHAADSWRCINIFETGARLPFLLPFKNPHGFTLNLPFSVSALYYVNAARTWEFRSNCTLFSYDIQKPLPFFPLFFMRAFTVEGGADYVLFEKREPLLIVHASVFSVYTMNSGGATGVPFDVGFSFKWIPPGTEKENFQATVKFNLKL